MRCGRCQRVFNARADLREEAGETPPPREEEVPTPEAPESLAPPSAESSPVETGVSEPLPAESAAVAETPEPEPSVPEAAAPVLESLFDAPPAPETVEPAGEEVEPAPVADIVAEEGSPAPEEEVIELTALPESAEPVVEVAPEGLTLGDAEPSLAAEDAQPSLPPAPRRWPWVAGNVALLLALVGQVLVAQRADLAVRSPALKPLLEQLCALGGCTVDLPRRVELIAIEDSDLQVQDERPDVLELSVTLRNRADYTQAYPTLELTLTDAADRPLARRLLAPADYLPKGSPAGMPPGREVAVTLRVRVDGLNPVGYRLYPFFPRDAA